MAVTNISKPQPRPSRFREILRQMRKNWSAYMFIAPGMIHFLIFTLFAVGFAFYISFHDWNIIRPEKPFVGLDNYVRLFGDKRFIRSVINTFTFMIGVPLISSWACQ